MWVPIQVMNNAVNVSSGLLGCERLEDIRGVPAIAVGVGLTAVTAEDSVTIFGPGRSIRSMAEQLRPVGGTADVTQPLPAPPKYVVAALAEGCGAAPEDHGPPIDE